MRNITPMHHAEQREEALELLHADRGRGRDGWLRRRAHAGRERDDPEASEAAEKSSAAFVVAGARGGLHTGALREHLAAIVGRAISPSRSTTTRRAWAAMSGSCVTMITVCPLVGQLLEHRMISSEVCRVEVAGRFVGEQDRRPFTSARAMATRWRWPPESSFGRWSMRSSSCTRSSASLARSLALARRRCRRRRAAAPRCAAPWRGGAG